MTNTVLHCDLNNFFASVECLMNPDKLLGKKFAVAGNPKDAHGIVLAKNTAAKRYGVRTGETLHEASAKCPDLLFVEPHYDSYMCFSRLAHDIYSQYTDKIEPFGIDECWLDVTDTVPLSRAKDFADRLRNEVFARTGLTISVGVSFSKSFAKLGSDMKKPNGTTVIDQTNFRQKLYHMAVSELLMVGIRTQSRLATLNIHTIGELANADTRLLERQLGINGVHLQQVALGIEDSPVKKADFISVVKSVGHGTTVKLPITSYEQARQLIYVLSEMVATRLRKYGLRAKLVHLTIQNTLLNSNGMQAPLALPTYTGIDIAQKAYEILRKLWNPSIIALRGLTVSTGKLTSIDDTYQTNIFQSKIDKKEKIENVIDGVRKRFGVNSISRAVLVDSVFSRDVYVDHARDDQFLPFKRV